MAWRADRLRRATPACFQAPARRWRCWNDPASSRQPPGRVAMSIPARFLRSPCATTLPGCPVNLDTVNSPPQPGRWMRAWRSPLARLLVFLLVLALVRTGIAAMEGRWVEDHRGYSLLPWLNVLATAIFVLAYVLLVRALEHRPAHEFGRRGWLPELAFGIALGAVLMTLIVVVLYLAGAYSPTAMQVPADVVGTLTLWMFVAVFEEIGLRAVIFRLVEEWLGSWTAIVVSAAAFGMLHMANPNANWAGAMGIALQSGVLYALVFMITRRLWAVIGIHFAWNLVEGTVFGLPVSGFEFPGFVVPTVQGPAWLTGGTFGPEASVPALLVCGAAALLAFVVARRRGRFRSPSWKRARRQGEGDGSR